ncbi:hypothetical protein TUM19329_36150 (plasmid) [Legionella antarctica]|uniref:Transmembrane protein n=1 Tax=Legionella antarctica TaxID=2708020 RepID=A0A6F8T989_9GAMM|nr:hypothetical protein [Legionella antarctica]BCA97254.1 hypothetical protein TUM19329_36150 [Legionella antarctica]
MNNQEMNTHELKKAITEDIETLKTLEVDIMPAHEYYKANVQLFVRVFLKLYGVILLGYLLPCPFYWKSLMSETAYGLLSAFFWMSVLALGLCLFAFLFIYSALNHYILIDCQLKNKLKTGGLMVKQIRRAGTIAYRIYAATVLTLSLFLFPGCALFIAFGAFFISGIVTSILVEMELNRIGISTLFTLVKNYFDKDKTLRAEFSQNK